MPMVAFNCEVCAKHVERYQPPKYGPPRFCGLRCRGLSFKGSKQSAAHVESRKRRGEQHHNWRGDGVSRKGGRKRALRTYVDIGPCVQCGATRAERHHKDDNTANNAPDNIEILCRRCHMMADGRIAKPLPPSHGEANGRARLTSRDVQRIREMRDRGFSFAKIGAAFGVSATHTRRIVCRLAWGHE